MPRFFVARAESTTGPSLFIYDVNESGFTLLETGRIAPEGQSINSAGVASDVSRDGSFAVLSHQDTSATGKTFSIFDLRDGIELIHSGVSVDGSNSGFDSQFSQDGSKIWHAFFSQWVGLHSFDGEAAPQIDRFRILGAEQAVGALSSIAVAGSGTSLWLLEESAGTITELDLITANGRATRGGIRFSPDGKFVAVYAGTTLTVYTADGTLSQVVSVSAGVNQTGWNVVWSPAGDRIYLPDRAFAFDGASLTQIGTYSGQMAGLSGGIILTSDNVTLRAIDVDTFQTVATLVGTVAGVFVAGIPNLGPTTPQELFNANYADASAADPKITALISPVDVQRSIDTDVANLVTGPNTFTVDVIFSLGELEQLKHYDPARQGPRVFWVKDDQPGLREGRNLLLKSYRIRSGDPSVPVACTFWG